MASFSARKPCAVGNDCKLAAIFNCEGCSKAFCTNHVADHRRLLGEEINEIIGQHDDLRNTLLEHKSKPESHPLVKQIDDWEQNSIAKVRQRANEARQELLRFTGGHPDELLKRLLEMSESLRQGQEHDAFLETDLRHWKETLDKLKSDLNSPSTIFIHETETPPLILNFSIRSKLTNDLFDQVFDNNVRIEENGHVAVHGSPATCTEIRGKNEFDSGCHQVRLRIEATSNNWMFLGINSKLTPLQNESYNSKSAYGWTSNNFSWSNGQGYLNKSSAPITMQTNDIIALTFDCENRTISMINERTKSKHELVVNLSHCPLPWQLHTILYDPNDRIRILSA